MREGSAPGASRGSPVFQAEEVDFRYPGAGRPTLSEISLEVLPGSVFALLGPNGSGKSTLIRVLLGVVTPQRGRAVFRGRAVPDWGRRELAREVGVVPQVEEFHFPTTVREVVAMGRYPHLGLWRGEGARDREAIRGAMERCGVEELAHRSMDALSGGERQRVRIARALAQEPRVLVLDEPTASLDVRYEMAIFELLGRLAREDGVTVLLVTHHLNLAARYASELLLMHQGRAVVRGSPEAVLKGEVLTRVYGWPVAVVRHPGPGPDTGAPQVVPLAGGDLQRGAARGEGPN